MLLLNWIKEGYGGYTATEALFALHVLPTPSDDNDIIKWHCQIDFIGTTAFYMFPDYYKDYYPTWQEAAEATEKWVADAINGMLVFSKQKLDTAHLHITNKAEPIYTASGCQTVYMVMVEDEGRGGLAGPYATFGQALEYVPDDDYDGHPAVIVKGSDGGRQEIVRRWDAKKKEWVTP